MSDRTGDPSEPTDGSAITPAIGATEATAGTDDLAAIANQIETEPDDPVATGQVPTGDLAGVTADILPLMEDETVTRWVDDTEAIGVGVTPAVPPEETPSPSPDGPPVDIIADEEELQVRSTAARAPESSEAIPVTPPDGADTGDETSGMLGGLRGFFKRNRDDAADESTDEVDSVAAETAGTGGIVEGLRGFVDPALSGIDTRALRYISAGAFVLLVALLLGNQAGGALILASAVIPVLIVTLLTAHDVYERESPLLVTAVGIAGAVAGVVIGLIAAWVVRGQWFDTGHLNFGAGGFGGHFAPEAAPWLVWLVVGLLLPAVIVAGLAAAPLLLRQWPQFANEVMDGMILAGTSAAGLSIGLAATFWWPMVMGDGPLMNVRDWTLTILGQAVLRPLVITLSGALIGAGVWRYMLNPKGSLLLLAPTVAGVLGILVLWIGSLVTQPGGIWPEFVLGLALVVLVFGAYRRTLDLAIAADRASMGDTETRMVCPSCHQLTPVGVFCARCGERLPSQE